ncbi:MAG: hypothetical protein QOF58_2029 [Pseudonocardiales bacterium]|nr:hypothetical protein [Pseudonocardiales bacterium]
MRARPTGWRTFRCPLMETCCSWSVPKVESRPRNWKLCDLRVRGSSDWAQLFCVLLQLRRLLLVRSGYSPLVGDPSHSQGEHRMDWLDGSCSESQADGVTLVARGVDWSIRKRSRRLGPSDQKTRRTPPPSVRRRRLAAKRPPGFGPRGASKSLSPWLLGALRRLASRRDSVSFGGRAPKPPAGGLRPRTPGRLAFGFGGPSGVAARNPHFLFARVSSACAADCLR